MRLADGRAFEGTVIFAPATAGFWQGRMIGVATTPVEVSGGGLQTTLPPSLNALGRQVMGRYRWWTRPSGLSGWLDVPDEVEATLAGLWDRGMFCIDGAMTPKES